MVEVVRMGKKGTFSHFWNRILLTWKAFSHLFPTDPSDGGGEEKFSIPDVKYKMVGTRDIFQDKIGILPTKRCFFFNK